MIIVYISIHGSQHFSYQLTGSRSELILSIMLTHAHDYKFTTWKGSRIEPDRFCMANATVPVLIDTLRSGTKSNFMHVWYGGMPRCQSKIYMNPSWTKSQKERASYLGPVVRGWSSTNVQGKMRLPSTDYISGRPWNTPYIDWMVRLSTSSIPYDPKLYWNSVIIETNILSDIICYKFLCLIYFQIYENEIIYLRKKQLTTKWEATDQVLSIIYV